MRATANAEARLDRWMWVFARVWGYVVLLTASVIVPLNLWLAWQDDDSQNERFGRLICT